MHLFPSLLLRRSAASCAVSRQIKTHSSKSHSCPLSYPTPSLGCCSRQKADEGTRKRKGSRHEGCRGAWQSQLLLEWFRGRALVVQRTCARQKGHVFGRCYAHANVASTVTSVTPNRSSQRACISMRKPDVTKYICQKKLWRDYIISVKKLSCALPLLAALILQLPLQPTGLQVLGQPTA